MPTAHRIPPRRRVGLALSTAEYAVLMAWARAHDRSVAAAARLLLASHPELPTWPRPAAPDA